MCNRLESAQTELEILAALAAVCWHNDGGEGAPEVPTGDELLAWWPDAPEEARKEANERLADLPWPAKWGELKAAQWNRISGTRRMVAGPMKGPQLTNAYRGQSPHYLGAEVYHLEPPDDLVVRRKLPVLPLHRVWAEATRARRPKHPLAPLLRAWWDRPRLIETDTNPERILPRGALPTTPSAVEYSRLDLLPPQRDQETELVLPEKQQLRAEPTQLALLPTEHEHVPASPLVLVDAVGFGTLQQGRGGRLDKRLVIYSIAALPYSERRPGGRYTWRPTLRELTTRYLWPRSQNTGLSSWKPSRHGRALWQAMEAVTLAGVVLPDGRLWRPVIVRAQPDPYNPDSEAIIEIWLPDDAPVSGPLVQMHGPTGLIAAGAVSDPNFDLHLSLAYLWDDCKRRAGGARIYATRPKIKRSPGGTILGKNGHPLLDRHGNPVTNWNDPRVVRVFDKAGRPVMERNPAADRMPVLDAEDRRRLAYGLKLTTNKGKRSQERRNADTLLEALASGRKIVLEKEQTDPKTGKRGWRIIEARPEGVTP